MSTKKQAVLGMVIVAFALTLFMPVLSIAGSLDPSAAPAPTMKTLDQIPPTWSEKITTGRFVDALGGAAVLDKETGLVWEKSPSTTSQPWANAIGYCDNKNVGGRFGWHLPTVEQLASLVDQSMTFPSLPSGHPFTGVQSVSYWSASTLVNSSTAAAWLVSFGSSGNVSTFGKTANFYVWCVRGGQTYDVQ